ncbi:MAG TPA: hypothetical protein VFA81_07865 [Burkholderiales bacterium]|nr:hypothetical protein [Burkholderiales bacterium]
MKEWGLYLWIQDCNTHRSIAASSPVIDFLLDRAAPVFLAVLCLGALTMLAL